MNDHNEFEWHGDSQASFREILEIVLTAPNPNPLITKKLNLHQPGAKDDDDKPPVGLVFESFPRALLAVAKVAGDGANKYTRGGWRTVQDGMTRYSDAQGRHTLKQFIEGPNDKESGSLHLAHAAWNALAILELALRETSNE
jgi:hypothetical protein